MTKPLTFAEELNRHLDADYLATTRKPPQPGFPRGRTLFREFEEMHFGRVE